MSWHFCAGEAARRSARTEAWCGKVRSHDRPVDDQKETRYLLAQVRASKCFVVGLTTPLQLSNTPPGAQC